MNVLTRTFVVVVTILSVVLVALVIPLTARVPDYAQQFEDMKQQRDAQLQRADETAAEVRLSIAREGIELDKLAAANAELLADLGAANNQIKALQTQLGQSRTVASRSAAGLEISARDNETKSQQIEKMSGIVQEQLAQIGNLQNQRGDLSQSLIEARGNIRRLSDQFLRVQEQNRALNQQLLESQASLKTALDRLAGFVEDAEQFVAEGPVKPATEIRGSVTKIDQITEGITFVQVNVGKRDLVEPGMEFTVFRGDQFVGKIQINSVDTAEAVGELKLGGGIQEGDAVLAGSR